MKKTLLAGIASLALIVPAVAQSTPPSSGATQGTQGQTSPQMNRPTGSGSTSTTTDTGRPAMQQTQSPSTTTPPSTAQSPSTTTPPSTAQTPSSGSSPSVAQGSTGGAGPYMNAPMQGQFLVSNLMDRTVYGSDGNSVGDVNDVVMDSSGNIAAVVIGVGGFLGIGEKDVAVPFNRLQVVHQQGRDGASGTSSTPSASGQSSATGGQTSGAGPGGTGQQSTAQSPTPPTSGTSGMGGSSFWANFSDDARLVLNATREELRNAPTFRARGDRGTAGTTGTGTSGQPTTNR